jgi:nucleoside-diphosphate-sugar epimerase
MRVVPHECTKHAVVGSPLQEAIMTTQRNLTLVLGGKGKSGQHVAKRLIARGVTIRVSSRSGEPPFDWNDLRYVQISTEEYASVVAEHQVRTTAAQGVWDR